MGHAPPERDRDENERDRQSDQRDRDADERDRQADQRDRVADERDRQADQRDADVRDGRTRNDATGGQDSGQAPSTSIDDGWFGVDLGPGNEPTEAAEPDVDHAGPPGRRPKSLAERLADAASDREHSSSPNQEDIPPSD